MWEEISQSRWLTGRWKNCNPANLDSPHASVDASEIINPLLRERVHYLKETEGGREEMCQIMENRINEEKIELAKKLSPAVNYLWKKSLRL